METSTFETAMWARRSSVLVLELILRRRSACVIAVCELFVAINIWARRTRTALRRRVPQRVGRVFVYALRQMARWRYIWLSRCAIRQWRAHSAEHGRAPLRPLPTGAVRQIVLKYSE